LHHEPVLSADAALIAGWRFACPAYKGVSQQAIAANP
jgi:hypothetical protein